MNFIATLGLRYPIIQAPMAGVSTPELAAAVSNAGGLGSLSIGASNVATARKMIETVRNLTNKPFNVNVFCHKPAHSRPQVEKRWIEIIGPLFDNFGKTPPSALQEIYKTFAEDHEMIAAVAELAPRVVSFHFGLPSPEIIQKLKKAGCILLSTATNLIEAQAAVATGVDAIVAQGYEAGGHRGVFDPSAPDEQLNTVSLTKMLVREWTVPVIASGGVMDGATIKKMLDEGAAAVQLGTAFISCPESGADDGYRQALAAAQKDGTTMTKVISGRPARCLQNEFSRWGAGLSDDLIPDYPIAYDAGKALSAAARAAGENGYSPQWAGEGAFLSRFMPAAELMHRLVLEMQQPISGGKY